MAKDAERGRLVHLGVALLAGVVVVAAVGLLAGKGSKVAVLLLDWSDPYTWILPYPFTIQNLMTLVFAAAIGDALWRRRVASAEAAACDLQLLPEDDRTVLVEADLPGVRARISADARAKRSFLGRSADQVILHFQANRTTGDAHSVLNSMLDLEMHRLDLNYTMLRYVAWLLPSLGFLGTVAGIAAALVVMKSGTGKVQMDAIVSNLSTAFNTTILGLLESMLLVFLMGQVQRREEGAVNAGADYCLRNLINRLYVPPENDRGRVGGR
jgi:biopolymer transport protein ExbB/TolQ